MIAPFPIRGDALPALANLLANLLEAPPEDRPHGMVWSVQPQWMLHEACARDTL